MCKSFRTGSVVAGTAREGGFGAAQERKMVTPVRKCSEDFARSNAERTFYYVCAYSDE